MDSGKNINKTKEVARATPRATFFAVGGILLAAILLFLGLRWIVTHPGIAPELKMAILFGAAFNSLILAYAAINLIWKKKRADEGKRLSIGQVIILAYGIPGIALLVMVFAYMVYSQRLVLNALTTFYLWISRLPFLWVIQVSMLAWIMCKSQHNGGGKRNLVDAQAALARAIKDWRKFLLTRQTVLAVLAGLGSWLAARYIFSISTNWLPGQLLFNVSLPNDAFRPLFWITGLIALTIGPWAEEVFFREYMQNNLIDRFGNLPSSLISTLLFGFLQFRPLLFIPAIVLGIVNLGLRSRYGMKTAILAHIFFNLLTFMFAWTQVL